MNITTEQNEYLQQFVETYENFPGPGIDFKDLSLLYTDNTAIKIIQNYFSLALNSMEKRPDCVIGCDARGFIIGTLISMELGIPLILARKPGKLPGKLLTKKYGLEYGNAELQMHKHIISRYKCPVIADDVLATGGTVIAVTNMLEEIGIQVNLNARQRIIENCGTDKIFSVLNS
jgi:adenine phosphoribosyltransferase